MNLIGALFSFLRVLAVAEASAYLALTTGNDPITAKAMGLAAASAFALTVVNFLRPGEPRFGPEPKVDEVGEGELRIIGLFAVAGLLALIAFHYLLPYLH